MLGERGRDVCFAEEEKEKTREAGLTTRVGRNAIYPVVKRLHPFHIRAAETFIRIRQD